MDLLWELPTFLRWHVLRHKVTTPHYFVQEDSSMTTNFGLANQYNVFVFGDMSLSNTYAEGRVAVGGTATLSNYGV